MDMEEKVSLREILCPVEPQGNLYGSVLSRIAGARRRAARLRFVLQSVVCFALGAALVPLAEYAGKELFNSGFYDYFSMIFSDKAFAVLSWQEIAYSLIEALPSVALLLILACSVALAWSFRLVLKNSRAAFMTLQH